MLVHTIFIAIILAFIRLIPDVLFVGLPLNLHILEIIVSIAKKRGTMNNIQQIADAVQKKIYY